MSSSTLAMYCARSAPPDRQRRTARNTARPRPPPRATTSRSVTGEISACCAAGTTARPNAGQIAGQTAKRNARPSGTLDAAAGGGEQHEDGREGDRDQRADSDADEAERFDQQRAQHQVDQRRSTMLTHAR